MTTFATAATPSAVTVTQGFLLDVHLIPGVTADITPYHGMCLDHQEFEHCGLYSLPQTVEIDPASSRETQEVVKQ